LKNNDVIAVMGSRGMVGSAVVRLLETHGYEQVLTPSRYELDLRDAKEVQEWFDKNQPKYVFMCAAHVGGIMANQAQPVEFLLKNLTIQNNVIDSSYNSGAEKLLFLGSSCIYPKFAKQPITEDQLLTGPLEPTNDSYAIAKIAGIKLCQAFRDEYDFDTISLMPTNLYGPNDNYCPFSSHVIPGMIYKFNHAKLFGEEVTLFGDGTPMREFLYVDDLAEAILTCMEKYSSRDIINIGTGQDVTIREVAEVVKDVVGYEGPIHWDTSKPNGTPRKVLNVDKIKALGWEPRTSLREGIEKAYKDFLYLDTLI